MHGEYLNDPSKTDVMTFNLGDDEIEGEIYISYDRAVEQAKENQVDIFNEITRLVIHGLLHLAGYDDNAEADRAVMKKLENELVESFS
jgi:rRNA maturation RNase YbeY